MLRSRLGRLAVTATAVLSMSAFAGCSAGSGGGAAGGSRPTGPITLTYLHRLPDGPGMTKVADIVATWNHEHPNIQVTATKFAGSPPQMTAKLQADVSAGTAPCLAQVGYTDIPSLYTKGMLADVTAQAVHYQNNYAPGAFSLMTVGGKTVGLPQDTGPLVYYYNKTAFKKLGLSAPSSIAQFTQTAAKAAKAGKFIADFEPDEAQNWLAAQAAAAGATWYSGVGGAWKVNVDSAASGTVASLWQTMIDAKTVLTEDRWGDGFKKALTDQTLIGTVGAAWEAPLLAGDMAGTRNQGQWAVAQLPTYGSHPMTGPDGGSGVAVLKGCAHPVEAMEFDNWFNTQVSGLVSQGLVVAAKARMTTPPNIAAFFGGQDVFAELETANQHLNSSFNYIPTFPSVGADMTQAASDAASGKATVAKIFTIAQNSSVKSLQDAGLPVAH